MPNSQEVDFYKVHFTFLVLIALPMLYCLAWLMLYKPLFDSAWTFSNTLTLGLMFFMGAGMATYFYSDRERVCEKRNQVKYKFLTFLSGTITTIVMWRVGALDYLGIPQDNNWGILISFLMGLSFMGQFHVWINSTEENCSEN